MAREPARDIQNLPVYSLMTDSKQPVDLFPIGDSPCVLGASYKRLDDQTSLIARIRRFLQKDSDRISRSHEHDSNSATRLNSPPPSNPRVLKAMIVIRHLISFKYRRYAT